MTSSDKTHDQDRPRQQYVLRYEHRRQVSRRYQRLVERLVLAKRIYLGASIGYAVFDPTVSAVLLPVAISLIPIVIVQYWLVRRWMQHYRAATFYRRALDRVDGCWIGSGDPGDRYVDVSHLYSSDLDIFGHGSLYQFLCTVHTASGRDTLALWLQRSADVETIRARQAAVREMADSLDGREALDATGAATPRVSMADVRGAAMVRPVLARPWLRLLAALLGWCWLVSLGLVWQYGGWWCYPFLLGLALEVTAYFLVRSRIRVLCERGYQVGLSLLTISAFAGLLTRTVWQSALLRGMRAALHDSPRPLPQAIAAPLGLLLQWPVAYFLAAQLVPMLETRLLARVLRLPAAWESIGQCEALGAFAALAFDHPDDCFPELVTSGTCFVATAMGHPLIPASRAVRNDVKLDQQLQLLMVSGSNMAGKSTLLRTVGVNAVLALAGAPVRARALRLAPLAVGTAMRFRDSLAQETSYFHAVLCRLRAVLDLLDKPLPLLFLLDEMLPGTNSHDRLVGAEAVIRRLLAGQAIGLVTTHDLELTRVVDQFTLAHRPSFARLPRPWG